MVDTGHSPPSSVNIQKVRQPLNIFIYFHDSKSKLIILILLKYSQTILQKKNKDFNASHEPEILSDQIVGNCI